MACKDPFNLKHFALDVSMRPGAVRHISRWVIECLIILVSMSSIGSFAI